MAKMTRGEQVYRLVVEATGGKWDSIDQITEVLRSAGLIHAGLMPVSARARARGLIHAYNLHCRRIGDFDSVLNFVEGLGFVTRKYVGDFPSQGRCRGEPEAEALIRRAGAVGWESAQILRDVDETLERLRRLRARVDRTIAELEEIATTARRSLDTQTAGSIPIGTDGRKATKGGGVTSSHEQGEQDGLD